MDMRRASAPDALAVWGPMAAWSTVLDVPRQQTAAAAHAACALFQGFEAMRRIQEQAAHQALKLHSEAAERLQGSCGLLDVFSIQLDLARFDFEAGARYWQELSAAALQMQAGMAACGCELVDSGKLLEACAVFEPHGRAS